MKVLSPAKVNLILRITGRDRSDGYHYIESIFDPVSLYDTIEIKRSRQLGIRLKVTGNKLNIPPEKNIVYKALQAVLAESNSKYGLDVILRKNIPDGAGLGGGSSNAASAILAADKILGLRMGLKKMSKIAFKCGADVPFFLLKRPAIVTGKGEKIRPINRKKRLWYVIAVQKGVKVPTREAYKWFDNEKKLTTGKSYTIYSSDIDSVVRYGLGPDCLALHNDFEGAVYGRYPELKILRDNLCLCGGIGACLSGSGSAVFAVFARKADAQSCYRTVKGNNKGSFVRIAHSV